MKKLSLLVAALLISGSVFANTSSTFSLGVRCAYIYNQNVCANTEGCFWDADDERCESYDRQGFCQHLNQYMCYKFSRFCFWDNDDERCERR